MKKFLLAESEKERILGMHYNAMGKTLVNEAAAPDPSWLKNAASQTGGQVTPFPAGTKITTGASAMAKNPGETKTIIVPKGTTFVLTPSGNFLVAKGYSVNATEEEFNPITALNNNQYIANKLKELTASGKATPIDVAVAKGVGGILYSGGMSPLAINGEANKYLKSQILAL
jgi:hypothetical protein